MLSPFSMERVPGAYKARKKSAPNPLQNTLHGKRALDVIYVKEVGAAECVNNYNLN